MYVKNNKYCYNNLIKLIEGVRLKCQVADYKLKQNLLQKHLNVDLHGSSRHAKVKGRYHVRMDNTQLSNNFPSNTNLSTSPGEVGGV